MLAETPTKVAAKLGEALVARRYFRAPTPTTRRWRVVTPQLGIGFRRSWIKAARPDLCGLRYALQDHESARGTLTDPAPSASPHPTIDSVSISGGFLSGTSIAVQPRPQLHVGRHWVPASHWFLRRSVSSLDQQVDWANSSARSATRSTAGWRSASARETTVACRDQYAEPSSYRVSADIGVSVDLLLRWSSRTLPTSGSGLTTTSADPPHRRRLLTGGDPRVRKAARRSRRTDRRQA